MITCRIVGLAVVFCFAEVPALFFTAFFAIGQPLQISLENSPSAWLKIIENLSDLIDGRSLLIGQVEFFAIKMLRIVVAVHFEPFFFVRIDFRLKRSATAP